MNFNLRAVCKFAEKYFVNEMLSKYKNSRSSGSFSFAAVVENIA